MSGVALGCFVGSSVGSSLQVVEAGRHSTGGQASGERRVGRGQYCRACDTCTAQVQVVAAEKVQGVEERLQCVNGTLEDIVWKQVQAGNKTRGG